MADTLTPPQATPPPALMELLGEVIGELGAAVSAALTLLGDELGLWEALRDAGPVTAAELAQRSGCAERYVAEWLAAQAAGPLVRYDAETGTFALPTEAALLVADEDSPVFLGGAFQTVAALYRELPATAEVFRTGAGVQWADRQPDFHQATARWLRTGWRRELVANWVPAVDGLEEAMRSGARVADVGCGEGAALVLLAQAYPASTFVGFDTHEPSLSRARAQAAAAGVGDRVRFETAAASEYPPGPYDAVWMFDTFHDLGDPQDAAAHIRTTLSHDGVWLLVEPRADDRLEDNLNPLGRICYGISTLICTATSLAQPGAAALGAQPGPASLCAIAEAAGFTRFRLAAASLTQAVYEVRP